MKKVILALAVVAFFTACNSGEGTEGTTDSLTNKAAAVDSTVKAVDSTVKAVDSTVKSVDSTVKAAVDSVKK